MPFIPKNVIFIFYSMQKPSDAATKRTYVRLDFTQEQEEQLIDFVKTNPVMYNPRDANYKNKMYRDRLWAEFGEKIDKSGNLEYYIILCLNFTLKNLLHSFRPRLFQKVGEHSGSVRKK